MDLRRYSGIMFAFIVLISIDVSAQSPALTIPDFSFSRLNKVSFTNKNLEPGKILFFAFLDIECDHCQRAILYIDKHYKEFINTEIHLICPDDEEKISRFMRTYGKNLMNKENVTVLQDLHYQFILKFRARRYPGLFLYSPKKQLLLYEDNEQTMFRFLNQIKASVK